MIDKLKCIKRPLVLCLAFLACAFALGSAPARADDAESVVVPLLAETNTTEVSSPAERSESCLWEGRVLENCVEMQTILAECAEEHPATVAEVDSLDAADPFLNTGAAIVVEVRQSTTIAAPGEINEGEVLTTGSVDIVLPVAETGSAIPLEITQTVTVATPGQVGEDEHDSINVASAAFDTDPPVPETGAAIVLEITQSVTVAAPGRTPEDNQDRVSVAVLPEHEEE